ncbi:MAG: phosphoribosylamine--glycine ligase [Candidatus Krumholzibacteria bacterium]|nr:phosphoribosylamine--glycine ligase [Candidatus Krumholzibacteria bacterium]
MNVLVLGSGGREHALAWAISRSPDVKRLYVAPGNGGTAAVAKNVALDTEDLDAVLEFALDNAVELTIVGPEAPLVAGIVDRFRDAGQRCFGPSQAAARLEGSKVFAKEFMKRHGVPSAEFAVFDEPQAAKARVSDLGFPVVIKADGLAQGKGVVVAESSEQAISALDEIMVRKKFGDSGSRVIVEEFLRGEEVSIHSICGGGRAVMLPTSQDHKRIFDRDRGPNTGGMGAYAPVPFVTAKQRDAIYETVVKRTLTGMEKEGNPFTGVLYAGLMMTDAGPKVLEFNVRFGDPETQALLPLMKSDLLRLLFESTNSAPPETVDFHGDRFAATVVVASQGYPGAYKKGETIEGLSDIETPQRVVFHAGTKRDGQRWVTTGGRVLAVTAWEPGLAAAIKSTYEGVKRVKFSGAYWRTDIGKKAL